MKGIFQILALSTALLASQLAFGENLAEIYEKALRNDPAIREAEANMRAQMEASPQARANLLPSLDATANWNRTNREGSQSFQIAGGAGGTDSGTVESDVDNYGWSVSLSQTLFDMAQWRSYKQADKQVLKSEIDYKSAQLDLIIRVSEAYFNVLAAQDTLASERAAKEAIGRQLEQANRRFEVGLIAITDVKESQAAYDDAIASEIAARRALASAKEALREITGEYPQTLATPGEKFTLVPPEPQIEQDWVDVSLQQNLALESARIQTEITREAISIARAGHAPTLDLVGSIGNSVTDGTTTTSASSFGTRVSPIDSDQDDTSFGVQFTLPIFSGGGTSSKVRENVYLHRASRENYEKVARNTEREARDNYLGVIAEIARVQALARSVESNQTALEATEAGYDVGTRTTVDVLNARDSLFKAQTAYARAKYDYLINVLKLKQAAGTLDAEDVIEINNWLEIDSALENIPGRGGEPDTALPEVTVPSNPDATPES